MLGPAVLRHGTAHKVFKSREYDVIGSGCLFWDVIRVCYPEKVGDLAAIQAMS